MRSALRAIANVLGGAIWLVIASGLLAIRRLLDRVGRWL